MTDRITRPIVAAVRRLLCACVAALPLVFGSAFAHEGHDEAPATRSQAPGLAPRVAAASPDLELLAVWQEGKLLIYLDRFETNEPVSDATVEIESGLNQATAAPAGAGIYQTSAPWLARPGRYPMVFTVRAKELADLLNGTLEIPERAAAAGSTHMHEVDAREHLIERWIWAFAAAVLMLLLAAIWATRRRNNRKERRP